MKPPKKLKASCERQEAGYWLVTLGGYSLKIYEGENRGEPLYTVSWLTSDGRKRETRRTFEDARKRAEDIASEFVNGTPQDARFTTEDKAIYSRAGATLAPLGIPVDIAAIKLAEYQGKLGGRTVEEAIDYFNKHRPAADASKTVPEVVTQFLAARKADGCGDRHLKDLENRLNRFAKSFRCSIVSVSTAHISDWLRGLKKPGGRTRNNYRNALRNLFRFAAAQKIISPEQVNWDEDNGVALARERDEAIEILTPAELVTWLTAARCSKAKAGFRPAAEVECPGLVVLFALGAFAGLRTSEIQAQVWEDIDLERGYLRVTKAKGNTPAKRLVPIADNLRQWLALYRKPAGLVCGLYNPIEAIAKLARRAKLKWKHNALRHSFISYRVALTGDVPRTAIEAGNSPAKIFSNYRELVTAEAAKAWFAIVPHPRAA